MQLYDSLRVDCGVAAARTFHISEHTSFFSAAAFSADGRRIAATGSHGGTYIFEVLLLPATCSHTLWVPFDCTSPHRVAADADGTVDLDEGRGVLGPVPLSPLRLLRYPH